MTARSDNLYYGVHFQMSRRGLIEIYIMVFLVKIQLLITCLLNNQ